MKHQRHYSTFFVSFDSTTLSTSARVELNNIIVRLGAYDVLSNEDDILGADATYAFVFTPEQARALIETLSEAVSEAVLA